MSENIVSIIFINKWQVKSNRGFFLIFFIFFLKSGSRDHPRSTDLRAPDSRPNPPFSVTHIFAQPVHMVYVSYPPDVDNLWISGVYDVYTFWTIPIIPCFSAFFDVYNSCYPFIYPRDKYFTSVFLSTYPHLVVAKIHILL